MSEHEGSGRRDRNPRPPSRRATGGMGVDPLVPAAAFHLKVHGLMRNAAAPHETPPSSQSPAGSQEERDG